MRILLAGIFSIFTLLLSAQQKTDAWVVEQLNDITWLRTYTGMLADYHPVRITLASDHKDVAGYLVHAEDQQHHRLIGEWKENGLYQLQEFDSLGRLTGYLTGSVKPDQLSLKWVSVDQSRIFDIEATTDQLIKISSKAPASEWIEIDSDTSLIFSVQKIGNGQVAGFVIDNGQYFRFDGDCLDGSCSIWKSSYRNAHGKLVPFQLRQTTKDAYKVTLADEAFRALIKFAYPLEILQIDQFAGFADLVFPVFKSDDYVNWMYTFWTTSERKIAEAESFDADSRLAYRSSGWVEVLDESVSGISGLITFINPEGIEREAFFVERKSGEMLRMEEMLNLPDGIALGGEMALASVSQDDTDYYAWLEKEGFDVLIPTQKGVVMATTFSTVFGDELTLLSMKESKSLIKKKYWRLFGW